jgi:phenylalanyl-tRNA synthetase alpha chain
MLKNKIDQLLHSFNEALLQTKTLEELEHVRITYLARQGKIAELMAELKQLSLEEKQIFGPLLNNLKQFSAQAFEDKKKSIEDSLLQQQLGKDIHFDVTAYLPRSCYGSLHPITHMYSKIFSIFNSMSYEILDGPEVETDYYNFEALNIPKNHPARDIMDTLWLTQPGLLLRTHTSTVQVHGMENRKPPFAVIAPGRVYRHEATDATHDYLFNQIEGLVVAKDISLSHLLATLKVFFRTLFEKKDIELKIRPDYFPFVEPGIEINISCPFCKSGCSVCKKTGFIEMGGAGLVHPNVLRCSNIDPKEYTGFAFGLGVDRIAMLMYTIYDIRLFSTNKVEFLKQF